MTGFLLQQFVNAVTIGALYALIALGYTMVYGTLKLHQLRARRDVHRQGQWLFCS